MKASETTLTVKLDAPINLKNKYRHIIQHNLNNHCAKQPLQNNFEIYLQ